MRFIRPISSLIGRFLVCALVAGRAFRNHPWTVVESNYVAGGAFENVASSAAAQDACFAAAENGRHDQLALPGIGNPAFSQQDWQTDDFAFRKVADMALGRVPSLNNRALTQDA